MSKKVLWGFCRFPHFAVIEGMRNHPSEQSEVIDTYTSDINKNLNWVIALLKNQIFFTNYLYWSKAKCI